MLDHAKKEVSIEKDYVESWENNGGWCPKWTSPGTPGVPDRIVFKGFGISDQLVQDHIFKRTGTLVPAAECAEIARDIVAAAIQFTELKTRVGKLRPRQRRILAKLRNMGYAVEVVRE